MNILLRQIKWIHNQQSEKEKVDKYCYRNQPMLKK